MASRIVVFGLRGEGGGVGVLLQHATFIGLGVLGKHNPSPQAPSKTRRRRETPQEVNTQPLTPNPKENSTSPEGALTPSTAKKR